MHQRTRLVAVCVAGMLFSAGFAAATPITNPYSGSTSSTLTSWEGALSGSATALNFSSLTGTEKSPYNFGGFTFSGFTKVTNQEFEGSSITINAPSGGETAMFLYINDQSQLDSAASFTLTLSDGESGSINLTSPCAYAPSCSYFGFTDTTAITSLTLTASSSTLSIGGFWYGTANGTSGSGGNNNSDPPDPAAEGATLVLASGGLLLLFGAGQRLGLKRIV